ncbi:MAG: O-antigen ligase family protein [Gammaproteobacteria bacterium]
MVIEHPLFLRLTSGSWRVLAPLTTGVAGACLVLAGSEFGPKVVAAVALAIPVVAAVVLKPRWGVILLMGALFTIEEFAGGLGEESVERSLRTPFYSMAIGIPGIYLPDIMVIGLLLVYIGHGLVNGTPLYIRTDRVFAALLIMALSVGVSATLSIMGPAPLGPMVLDLSTMGSVTLYEKIARLIGVLQIKLFVMIFPAYLLGLCFFRDKHDIRDIARVLLLSMLVTIAASLGRLVANPSLVRGLVPVIYDTATVWFMAMVVFHAVGAWAGGRFDTRQTIAQSFLCLFLVVLILLSFRRTMWGAIAIALVFFPWVTARRAWPRLLFLGAFGTILGAAVLVGTAPGRAILSSVLTRLGETNFSNPSTLYRYSLLVYVVDNFWDLPAFGFGITPLWNEMVHIRLFKASMENIHSLFFWVLLRFGYVGFIAFAVATGLVFSACAREYRRLRDSPHAGVVAVIVVALIMFLVNGVTNPVFGNIRFMVPLGFAFALLTRLPDIVEPATDVRTPERRAPA